MTNQERWKDLTEGALRSWPGEAAPALLGDMFATYGRGLDVLAARVEALADGGERSEFEQVADAIRAYGALLGELAQEWRAGLKRAPGDDRGEPS